MSDQANPQPEASGGRPADPAQQSLSDALRTSFNLLRGVMLVLVAAYLFSGFFAVKSNEKAVRLRFGRLVESDGAARVYEPGTWYAGLPFPFEQVVRVPTSENELDIVFTPEVGESDRKLSAEQLAGRYPTLTPVAPAEEERDGARVFVERWKDGALVTADQSLVHMRAQARWQVRDDAAGIRDYLAAVGGVEAGNDLVESVVESACVRTAAGQPVERFIGDPHLSEQVRALAQDDLDRLKCGLVLSGFTFSGSDGRFAPYATAAVLADVGIARSERSKNLEAAQKDAVSALVGAAGPAHTSLRLLLGLQDLVESREGTDSATARAVAAEVNRCFESLRTPGPAVEQPAAAFLAALGGAGDIEATRAALLAALASAGQPGFARVGEPVEGQAATLLSGALVRRTQAVEQLRAEADAFKVQLAQYRENPALFMSRRKALAWERVLAGPTVEANFLPVAPGTHLQVTRDPEVSNRVDDARFQQRKGRAGVN